MDGGEYLVSSFVTNLFDADPEGFAYLDTLVKGAMLAAFLYLPDPGRVQEHFRNVRVVLDTPFLLQALGLSGDAISESCREFLDLVYELGGKLCCFDFTVDETRGVLEASANSNSFEARLPGGPDAGHFHHLPQKLSSSDLAGAPRESQPSPRRTRSHGRDE